MGWIPNKTVDLSKSPPPLFIGNPLIKQIKTIWKFASDSTRFDIEVNKALKNGWKLIKREFVKSPNGNLGDLLYAELEKFIESEDK